MLGPATFLHSPLRRRTTSSLEPVRNIQLFCVLVGLDPLALGEGLPHAGPEASFLVLVVGVAQERYDGLGGLLGVVLRNAPGYVSMHLCRGEM
jgi:hypothetical protein